VRFGKVSLRCMLSLQRLSNGMLYSKTDSEPPRVEVEAGWLSSIVSSATRVWSYDTLN